MVYTDIDSEVISVLRAVATICYLSISSFPSPLNLSSSCFHGFQSAPYFRSSRDNSSRCSDWADDQHKLNEATNTAYYVPRFFPAINVLEQLLEFVTFQLFNTFKCGHNLLFQPFLGSIIFLLRPPPPGLHKESEPNDRVVHLLPIFNLLSRTVGKRIIGGRMMSNTAKFWV